MEVSVKGLCLAFSAGWEHTRPTQHSHCSAVRMKHLQGSLTAPTMGSVISPASQTGEMEAKKQTATKETQNQPHTKQLNPPERYRKKIPTQDVKFRAALPQHTHSWMEKKGMLEGCGMMAALGTAWQEVNRLWLRESARKQEGLRKCQPARKVLWP